MDFISGEVMFLTERGAEMFFGDIRDPNRHLPHIYRPVCVDWENDRMYAVPSGEYLGGLISEEAVTVVRPTEKQLQELKAKLESLGVKL